MRGTDFSKVFSSNPVNATASRVTSGGVHWVPDRKQKADMVHALAPSQCIPPRDYPKVSSFTDLRGITFGRFTVVGYLGKMNKQQKAMWLVRCACSAYEHRTARSINNPANDRDACLDCRHLRFLKENGQTRAPKWTEGLS